MYEITIWSRFAATPSLPTVTHQMTWTTLRGTKYTTTSWIQRRKTKCMLDVILWCHREKFQFFVRTASLHNLQPCWVKLGHPWLMYFTPYISVVSCSVSGFTKKVLWWVGWMANYRRIIGGVDGWQTNGQVSPRESWEWQACLKRPLKIKPRWCSRPVSSTSATTQRLRAVVLADSPSSGVPFWPI